MEKQHNDQKKEIDWTACDDDYDDEYDDEEDEDYEENK